MRKKSKIKKEKWGKPELIILTRGTPEERSLTACKQSPSGDGPSTRQTGCQVGDPVPGVCSGTCESLGS